MFQESVIYYEDTLNKAGHITRKTKTKTANGTLYGLTYHVVIVSQQE